MKSATQKDIARRCGLNQGSISRILNRNGRELFAQQTVERVIKVAREMGYLHSSLVTTERRDSPRQPVSATVQLRIVGLNGNLFSAGTAMIANCSLSGMLLRSIQLPANELPIEPLRFDVEVTSPPLKGFRARCRPVRFAEEAGCLAIAVQYETLDDANRQFLKSHLG
jgi:transcriptional regulator with XRE-family HTH domain